MLKTFVASAILVITPIASFANETGFSPDQERCLSDYLSSGPFVSVSDTHELHEAATIAGGMNMAIAYSGCYMIDPERMNGGRSLGLTLAILPSVLISNMEPVLSAAIATDVNEFPLFDLPEDRVEWSRVVSEWITENPEAANQVKYTVLAERDSHLDNPLR